MKYFIRKITSMFKRLAGKCLLYSNALLRLSQCFNINIKKYKLLSLYEYCMINEIDINVIDDRVSRNYRLPPDNLGVYEKWKYDVSIEREVTKQYVVKLNDVMITGQADGVFINEYYLSDRILYDIKGFMAIQPHNMLSSKKNVVLFKKQDNMGYIVKGIFLIKMGSSNYFHFLIEGLSRLNEIDKCSEYNKWPLIIDEIVSHDTRNVDIINIMNVNHRKIIWLKNTEYCYVQELVIPPCNAWGIWDTKKVMKLGWGYMIDPKVANYIRDKVLTNHINKVKYKCVYIARGNNKRLVNEDIVINYLAAAGFDIFYPDRASFLDEVDCFSTADCIVLCAGGASTNIIFCKKSVEIYCILPFKYRADSPIDISGLVGVVPHLCNAEIVKNGDILMHSTFSFSIKQCDKIIGECKEKGYLS